MKLIIATQTSLALPLIQDLYARQQLAAVWLYDVTGDDSRQLATQCAMLGIGVQVMDPEKPEALLQHQSVQQADAIVSCYLSFLFPPAMVQALQGKLLNIHASDLPQWRGADPLFWQIGEGAESGCLTLHQIAEQADTGDILYQQMFNIHPYDTHQSLNISLSQYMPLFIGQWLSAGGMDCKPQPQRKFQSEDKPAPRPDINSTGINWQQQGCLDIFHLARACNPQLGGAAFSFNQDVLYLLEATPVEHPRYGLAAGTIVHIGEPEGLLVACHDGVLRLDIIYLAAGIFSGLRFAERYQLQVGQSFDSYPITKREKLDGRNNSQYNELCR